MCRANHTRRLNSRSPVYPHLIRLRSAAFELLADDYDSIQTGTKTGVQLVSLRPCKCDGRSIRIRVIHVRSLVCPVIQPRSSFPASTSQKPGQVRAVSVSLKVPGSMLKYQQDVRDIRAAVSDMERTRLTVGEADATHLGLSRLQETATALAVRVGILENN